MAKAGIECIKCHKRYWGPDEAGQGFEEYMDSLGTWVCHNCEKEETDED